jgi:hypothetical protein
MMRGKAGSVLILAMTDKAAEWLHCMHHFCTHVTACCCTKCTSTKCSTQLVSQQPTQLLADVRRRPAAARVGPAPLAAPSLRGVGPHAVLLPKEVVGLDDVLRHVVAPVLVGIAGTGPCCAIQPPKVGPVLVHCLHAYPVEAGVARQQRSCKAGSRPSQRCDGWPGVKAKDCCVVLRDQSASRATCWATLSQPLSGNAT